MRDWIREVILFFRVKADSNRIHSKNRGKGEKS
jgi:hypothetical protein